MTQLPRLEAPEVAAFFAHGRSPACWQRQINRSASKQVALARACHWVDEVARGPSPRLQTDPLLGSCLAELVAAAPPPAEPGPVERPRSPQTSGAAVENSGHPARKRPLPSPPPARQMGPPLLRPAQAHPDLLRRWAEPTAVTHSPTRPNLPRRRAESTAVTHPHSHPPTGRRPTPSANAATAQLTASPTPLGSEQSAQAWADHLIGRTRKQMALAETTVFSPASKSNIRQTSDERPEEASTNLEEQWQRSLSGKPAPPALLTRLQTGQTLAANGSAQPKPARAPGAAPPSQGQETAAAASPSKTAAPGPILPDLWPPAPQPGGPAEAMTARGRDGKRPFSPIDSLPQTAVVESAPPHPDDANDGWFTAPRFSPPQTTEILPRLRPLPRPGLTSQFPIAAATAQSSAHREADITPEELSDLARKLKQILDEESRRHGIDV
jgi:hypothetical protein